MRVINVDTCNLRYLGIIIRHYPNAQHAVGNSNYEVHEITWLIVFSIALEITVTKYRFVSYETTGN